MHERASADLIWTCCDWISLVTVSSCDVGSGGRGDHFVAYPLRANCDCGYGYGYSCGGHALAWRLAIGNALMSSDAPAGT